MKYEPQRKIGISIMIVAIIVEIWNILFVQGRYWDLGAIIFLIGVICNDLAILGQLKKYEAKYGKI